MGKADPDFHQDDIFYNRHSDESQNPLLKTILNQVQDDVFNNLAI